MKSRTGLSKAKHVEIQYLRLQEAARSRKLTAEKVPTETNSSNLGTKHLTSERSEMVMGGVNASCMNIIQVRLVLELSSWIGDVRSVMKGPAACVRLLRSGTPGL